MPNFASINLIGHCGPDPKLSFLPDGTPILRFSLAVNTGWKDKKVCTWYRCSLFGRQAEGISKYLNKGKAVVISGEPSLSVYNSDNGKTYTNIEVRVVRFGFAGDNHESRQETSNETSNEISEPMQGTIPF